MPCVLWMFTLSQELPSIYIKGGCTQSGLRVAYLVVRHNSLPAAAIEEAGRLSRLKVCGLQQMET